jgi:serine/threonine-protein kinase
VLDRYELVEPIAEGAMGVVWLARHSTLDIDVAVKLPNVNDTSAGCQLRAFSEARLAAQLQHPAVCRVLDFGLTAEGDPCVVTEWLEGETLASALAREGRLSPIEAVGILLPVLEALSLTHERGVVHQDVKPENLFLARDAQQRLQPKLLDFGIAREKERRVSWFTSGSISGTPFYMSPEQASARDDIDARADVWGVCATLYDAVTGQLPFYGDTCEEVLARVIHTEPRPILDHGAGDATLSAIVQRGLEKDRERRFASAADLALSLGSWLIDQGVDTDVTGHSLRARFASYLRDESCAAERPSGVQTRALGADAPVFRIAR